MSHALKLAGAFLALAVITPTPASAGMDASSISDWATSMAGVEAPSETAAPKAAEPAAAPSADPTDSTDRAPRAPKKPFADDTAKTSPGDAVSDSQPTGEFPDQPGMGKLKTMVGSAIGLALPEEAPKAGEVDAALEIHTFYVRDFKIRSSSRGCPTAADCGYFSLMRERWANPGAISYYVNEAGKPAGAPGISSAVGSAAGEWNRWVPSINFVGRGSTTASPGQRGDLPCGDGINTIGWRSLGVRAAGVSYICFDRKTRQILDVDMALNSRLQWANLGGADSTSQAFDLRSIMTHEFGHFLSLKDLRGSRGEGLTMAASAGPGEVNKRTLGLGDILGARAAYPCACGTPSGVTSD